MLITVKRVCPFCGAKIALPVQEEDYKLWQNGASAQYAFRSPTYTDTDREFFITGLCEDCQAKTFREWYNEAEIL